MTTTTTTTRDMDIQIASVYHAPLAVGRERILIMRHYPRGVPMKRPDGALSFDYWVPDAAPSRELLAWLHENLPIRVISARGELRVRARFMRRYVEEVSTRLIDRIVWYSPTIDAPKGWEREVISIARQPRAPDAKRQTVIEWLRSSAQPGPETGKGSWIHPELTLLCHEKTPADPEEEARGLYCHRAALLKLLQAPDVDSVLRHYQQVEEEGRASAKIKAR